MAVVHLFCKVTPLADAEAISSAVQKAQAEGDQVVTVAILGHKADLAFMALGYDMWRIRRLQAALQNAGLIFSAVLVCQQQALQTSENAPLEAPQDRRPEHHGLVLA